MYVENEGKFDEVSKSASAHGMTPLPSNATAPDVAPVEQQLLTIPSNGNVLSNLRELEIRHQTQQAWHKVKWLQDIVADISFWYSHVVRGAIRRTVQTTAQKNVKSLHRDLILHARIYTHCQSRLIALNCDQHWLQIFRNLTKSDLTASTAILRPNIPGSSSFQLSWIWQTG